MCVSLAQIVFWLRLQEANEPENATLYLVMRKLLSKLNIASNIVRRLRFSRKPIEFDG